MNQQFDDQFKKIKSLKWLPWIGDKFLDLNSDNRIMVIGESHYFRPEEIDKEKHEKEDFTRTVVAEMALKKNYYKTKFFQNTLRGILGKKGPEFIDFWNQVAFMNLVQKPIQKDTAPTQQDFLIGWEACFEVIRVIKPAICLFIGVEASNFFPKAAKQNNHFKSDGMEKKSKVVQTYPRVVNLLTNNQEKVSKLVFIRHSSQYFSWSKWHHQFLKHEIPGPIQFLKRQLTVMQHSKEPVSTKVG